MVPYRELQLSRSTPRGEGGQVGPKVDKVLQISKEGCVNLRKREVGVQKLPELCQRDAEETDSWTTGSEIVG